LASPVAGCELNVAIRTVEFDAVGNAVLGSGGGITADSDPDAEWEECLHKAAPIIGAGVGSTPPESDCQAPQPAASRRASSPGLQHRVVELTP
jgi:para-aminobenzoate synthetase component 1